MTARLITGLLAFAWMHLVPGSHATAADAVEEPEALVRAFLTQRVATREAVDYFLDPSKPRWAMYDPDLGYRLNNSAVRDGMDGAVSFYTYSPTGERRAINWADRRCRINTYGDSFTQCHQVSDGETWQEYLAAHLGEPIRNYGVGGYGVYQAYRRMLREEATANAAEWIILNIFDDDNIGIFIHWSVFSVSAVAWVYPDKPYGFGGHSCWYGMYIDRLHPLSPPEQAKGFGHRSP